MATRVRFRWVGSSVSISTRMWSWSPARLPSNTIVDSVENDSSSLSLCQPSTWYWARCSQWLPFYTKIVSLEGNSLWLRSINTRPVYLTKDGDSRWLWWADGWPTHLSMELSSHWSRLKAWKVASKKIAREKITQSRSEQRTSQVWPSISCFTWYSPNSFSSWIQSLSSP